MIASQQFTIFSCFRLSTAAQEAASQLYALTQLINQVTVLYSNHRVKFSLICVQFDLVSIMYCVYMEIPAILSLLLFSNAPLILVYNQLLLHFSTLFGLCTDSRRCNCRPPDCGGDTYAPEGGLMMMQLHSVLLIWLSLFVYAVGLCGMECYLHRTT